MLMPGRQFGQGENFPGVLVNGTTTVNGYTIPIDLSITGRVTGDAAEYVASNSVEFGGEFESIVSDEFSASIADGTYAGTGNQLTGGGAYGTAGRYRYGFGGQESSNDIKGIGNSYTAENWEYDPRLGKRWNVDPIPKTYESPYSAFANNPISYIDPNGADTININRTTTVRHLKGFSDGHSDNLVTPGRSYVTQSGEIVINQAKGDDVFKITNTTINIDENGNQTSSSNTTTLTLNNPQTFYRSGGHNMEGFVDDRYALAAYSPDWLLESYANKSGDIGVRSAIAYQKDMRALPYITATVSIAEIIFTGGLSGWFSRGGVIRFNSMRDFTGIYGTAPKGMNWHQYVEQRLAKNGTFSPQLIYSTENSVLIRSGTNSPHSAISSFYSSKRTFTGDQTVRQWMGQQSFEFQMKYGKDIYNRVMNGLPLPK